MNFDSESVRVVAERVFDRAEDLFGWRVGECLGHRAGPLFEEWFETFHELADAGLPVFWRYRHWGVGVSHDGLTEGDLLHQR